MSARDVTLRQETAMLIARVTVLTILPLLPALCLAQERPASGGSDATLAQQVAELTALVRQLQGRVADLESKVSPAPQPEPANSVAAALIAEPAPQPVASSPLDILRGTTVNVALDGYYGWNFNQPIGRVNLLRAYDVSSNAFSLNQADLIFENAPDPAHGKRWGVRLDFQYGQATSTLQGNSANEPRPDIYRNIFQAYGTFVAPLGGGLTVDVGKWASSIGLEGNYTKDQINYSRSLWFDFLPFYHEGARASYKVSDSLSLNYWIANGTQQVEPTNGYKDQLFGFALNPTKAISWTANYYVGQEHPDFQYLPNSTDPNLPTQQGTPFAPIVNPPNGKLHIFDSYATWNASSKLSFAVEGDYVVERLLTTSPPSHTIGGALYARYQLNPRWAIAARSEYLSDRGGLFTGATQAIKENTFTVEQKIADGFLLREEWRRDSSNHGYFLTDRLGFLKKEQNTATVGVVWWFGAKQGIW